MEARVDVGGPGKKVLTEAALLEVKLWSRHVALGVVVLMMVTATFTCVRFS